MGCAALFDYMNNNISNYYQVPCWSVSDVQYWVEKVSYLNKVPNELPIFQIGFGTFSETFAKNMVDGDLLLLITEKELEEDLDMKSSLLRKRFMRELESLKVKPNQ
jgi:hypothetical protein